MLEIVLNVLRQFEGSRCVGIRQDAGKLFAAEAGDCVIRAVDRVSQYARNTWAVILPQAVVLWSETSPLMAATMRHRRDGGFSGAPPCRASTNRLHL